MLVQAEGVEGDPKAEIDIWAERQSDSAESPLPPPAEVGGGGEQMSNQRRKECGSDVTEQREPELGAGVPGAQTSFSAKGSDRTVACEGECRLSKYYAFTWESTTVSTISDLITDSLKATEGLNRDHGAESQANYRSKQLLI